MVVPLCIVAILVLQNSGMNGAGSMHK